MERLCLPRRAAFDDSTHSQTILDTVRPPGSSPGSKNLYCLCAFSSCESAAVDGGFTDTSSTRMPFSQVGIDYAGPILMRDTKLRKSREYKIYIAVFICMSVKAVHLEVVSDLSTDAFLAALDRFVARRRLPSDIYSDCGTNFIGASKELKKLVNLPDNQHVLAAAKMCSWHFNPPSAPHFGGLWEVAVRSAKTLLTRTVGSQRLTLEEMCTVLCRVEAALNSRPLVPLSSDPRDLECLTPGHFIIGQPPNRKFITYADIHNGRNIAPV